MSKESNNIKVAVRVRPFNKREKDHQSQLIVKMKDKTTVIIKPDGKDPITFTFDYSYWSHDSYKVREDGYFMPEEGSSYTDQEKVFKDLGCGMLDHAWKGYNSSIFAYGQTGSGKSYSIMGDKINKGLVPRICEELFNQIQQNKKPDLIFEVKLSMIEIYNEQVQDLLSPHKAPTGGLKVRGTAGDGFAVEGLVSVVVGSFEDIEQRMNEGNKKRTIAATKMNETSSNQKDKTSKQSTVQLVDLAGSERQKQTEATGDRFKEAVNINKSLLTLGTVIHALVENAKGKKPPTVVPYRDSVLTMLLKNAIGGNSKTVMIAALGPDAENYEQTLSTLKYADRVKAIRTDAKINQVETNKMIAALIAEKKKLLSELEDAKKTQGFMGQGYSEDDIRRLKEEQQMELKSYEEKLKNMEKAMAESQAKARMQFEARLAIEKAQEEALKRIPNLSNLNEDAALCDKLRHLCHPGVTALGKDSNQKIVLHGPGIVAQHAELRNENDRVTLVPLNGAVLHNGIPLTQPVQLTHGDRIRFGSNNLYLFQHPGQAEEARKKKKNIRLYTYEDAQEEIAKNSGLDLSSEDRLLQDEVISVLPIVQTVNAVAQDMNKPVSFDMLLVSPEARGLDSGRTELYIRVIDEETGNEFLWTKAKFLTRQSHMLDMYTEFESSGAVPEKKKEDDPFWEPHDMEVLVGVASVPMTFLAYMMDFKEDPLTVMDLTAQNCGFLEVQLIPCDSKGNEGSDHAVDDPTDLVSKPAAFKIKICKAMNLPARFAKTYCRYKFYIDGDYAKTEVKAGQNPVYNHEKLIAIPKVDHKFIDYLQQKSLPIEIYGQQHERVPSARVRKGVNAAGGQNVAELKQTVTTLQGKLDCIRAIVEKMPSQSPQKIELLKVLQQ